MKRPSATRRLPLGRDRFPWQNNEYMLTWHYPSADQKEFIKICQAVGMGFLIMGAVGYIVKLSECSVPWAQCDFLNANPFAIAVHIPVNNVLVGGA